MVPGPLPEARARAVWVFDRYWYCMGRTCPPATELLCHLLPMKTETPEDADNVQVKVSYHSQYCNMRSMGHQVPPAPTGASGTRPPTWWGQGGDQRNPETLSSY